MQRNLSSSGLGIHVFVDRRPIDFVAGGFDSFGFGSERGVGLRLCRGWMAVRGVVHCFVFVDPGPLLQMHAVIHDVLTHVVQELEKAEEVVVHSVEMHSNVGSVGHQLVRDGSLAVIVACIPASAHIVRHLVGPTYVSEG